MAITAWQELIPFLITLSAFCSLQAAHATGQKLTYQLHTILARIPPKFLADA